MISVLLLAALLETPPLEQAQTCRAHMELMIEEVAAAGDHVAGPTWFINSWWDRQAMAAGAPEDDGRVINLIKTGLLLMRADEPERFDAERQDCVDTAINAGAVPGMGPA
jgi:hypothetical protein